MKFEDHFSELAKTYLKYRPRYPAELFEYLASCCKEHQQAWDCGTGNGQAAVELANYFEKIIATDGSREQIDQAVQNPKIIYKVEAAENFALQDSGTDLVTVAQAVHWFQFDKFYSNVIRILKPGGVIAVWTYNKVLISAEVNNIIDKYMNEILDGYWPDRFIYVKAGYQNLPFPFKEILPPAFEMTAEWNLEHLTGFLNSWSGTKNYLKSTGKNPLSLILEALGKAWGSSEKKYPAHFPLHLRVGTN